MLSSFRVVRHKGCNNFPILVVDKLNHHLDVPGSRCPYRIINVPVGEISVLVDDQGIGFLDRSLDRVFPAFHFGMLVQDVVAPAVARTNDPAPTGIDDLEMKPLRDIHICDPSDYCTINLVF